MNSRSTLRAAAEETNFGSALAGIGTSEKLCWIAAFLCSLFFLVTSIYISTRRLLWFDELNAIRTAKLPDLATFWRVQNSWFGDSAPVVYGLLVRFVHGLTGGSEIGMRFVSAVALSASILI